MKKKIILILLSIFLLIGCATQSKHAVKSVCRNVAEDTAATFADHKQVPVRVVVGVAHGVMGKIHAQAQAYIEGEWKWLVRKPDGWVDVGSRHQFTPRLYYSLEEFRKLYDKKNVNSDFMRDIELQYGLEHIENMSNDIIQDVNSKNVEEELPDFPDVPHYDCY